MAACRSTTEWKTPCLSLRRVSLAKKPSTALSQEQEVGVKWKVHRGWRASQRQTQLLVLPASAMIAKVPGPSALKRIIRARQTCFRGLLGSETTARNRWRSLADTIKETHLRVPKTRTP
jgi:hypothetical protein